MIDVELHAVATHATQTAGPAVALHDVVAFAGGQFLPELDRPDLAIGES